MKIKFDSDDYLPLNKQIKFPTMMIVVRSAAEEDCKFYPQVFLDECLYDLKILQKELILIKQMNQKSMIFVIIGIF